MNRLSLRQVSGVIGLEWKKTFLSRRGWWVYLLALGPLGINLMHTLVSLRRLGFRGHTVFQDSQIFAGEFELYFLHLGIFFGCMGIFSNLFRGEMLERTLHYYFLTPMRRELLVVGKFLAGLIVALVLFEVSVGASFWLLGRHQGVHEVDADGSERHQVDPPAPARKKRLLPLQPDHTGDLAQPQPVHTVPPSPPIRYW